MAVDSTSLQLDVAKVFKGKIDKKLVHSSVENLCFMQPYNNKKA